MVAIAEGQVIAGKYSLERPLARGGMGSVWIVRHLQLDALMAAKFMDTSLVSSPIARGRFEREARAAAQLRSPHVVQVHDYGVEDDTPYLVMELLHGEDLGARIRRVGRLSPAAVAEILLQAARALRRAHEAGIVHRDLKPGNVFLAHNDDVEVLKVLDFGIAKAARSASEDATKTGQILGSPHYMSPEQARRSTEVDHRTDVWALAVIAYRSLTGEHPFPGDEIYEVILAICSDPALPPSHHVPTLGPEIDRFFERAFTKDPAARFQTAPELASAFARAAGVKMAASELSQSSPGMSLPSFATLPETKSPIRDAGAAAPKSAPGPAQGVGQTVVIPKASDGTPMPAAAISVSGEKAPLAATVAEPLAATTVTSAEKAAGPLQGEGTLTQAPLSGELKPRRRFGVWGSIGIAVIGVLLGGFTAARYFASSSTPAAEKASPSAAPSSSVRAAAAEGTTAPTTGAATPVPATAAASPTQADNGGSTPRPPGPATNASEAAPVPGAQRPPPGRTSSPGVAKPPPSAHAPPKPYDPLEHI